MILRRVTCGIALAFVVLAAPPAVNAQEPTELTVVRSTFRVEPGKASQFRFTLPAYYRDGRIAGNALAEGGWGNDIRVLILTARQFETWARNVKSETLFNSGQRRSVVLSVPVTDPGTYYVVFDNRFSTLAAKRVQADIRFVHGSVDSPPEEDVARQATERERRIGGILGRLVEKLQALEKQLGTRQIRTPLYVGVVDDPSINAKALWRRRAILVSRGTMEVLESIQSNAADDVLAGVLAHELAHIFYRHSSGSERQAPDETGLPASATSVMITPLVSLAGAGLALDRHRAYDRVQEAEADLLGARLACAAGFNPSGALTYLELFNAQKPSRLGFLKGRPAPVQRVQHLQGAIEKLDCPGATASASVRAPEPEDPAKNARVEKAQGELRILASAISLFVLHTGQLPPDLAALTNPVQNQQGAVVGPFLAVLPTPPPGWTEYAYAPSPDGRFSVTTKGDDTTLSVP